MAKLTLDQANTIIDVAIKKGQETKMGPLSAAVVDAGGNLVLATPEGRRTIPAAEIFF